MTTIILPVSPKEAMNVLNDIQTIIIRKSVPKAKLPIKVCLYCSDSKDYLLDKDRNYFMWDKHGHHYFYKYEGEPKEHYFQKKVVGSFTLREVEELYLEPYIYDSRSVSYKSGVYKGEWKDVMEPYSCINEDQMDEYLGDGSRFYAYHVSDLKILKEPKKPSEFKYRKKYHGCKRCPYGKEYNPASDFSVCYTCSELLRVSRVHGPYMYVEDEE